MTWPLSTGDIVRWIHECLPTHRKITATDYRGPCPLHGGHDANHSIDPTTGNWYCHSQCQRGGSLVQLAAEMQSTSPGEAIHAIHRIVGRPAPNGNASQTLIELEAYDYTDQAGNVVFQQVRYWDPIAQKKTFKTRHRASDGRWVYKRGGTIALYRWPKLVTVPLAADAPDLFVVEGEKDVHTLESWGFIATTNPGGAGKWCGSYSEVLKGRNIIVIPDNDEPGRKHSQQVVESLTRRVSTSLRHSLEEFSEYCRLSLMVC